MGTLSAEVVELFAGPGGLSEGARLAGAGESLGYENDPWACATAIAAGHRRVQVDVAAKPLDRVPFGLGLMGSPPCPPFSTAGNGKGKLDAPRILHGIEMMRQRQRWVPYRIDGWHDPRSPLTLEPLRWALTTHPRWCVFEQVPGVLPLWEATAEVLASLGYSTAVGKLKAEQFGVPQTRTRAFLLASLEHDVALPTPTHRAYRKGVAQHEGDPALLPWVSMADALGWGMDARPSMTVTGGGSNTGGAEPFGNGARQSMQREHDEGRWQLRQNAQANATVRNLNEPAPTITAVHDRAERVWVVSTGVNSATVGPGPKRDELMASGRWREMHKGQERSINAPAPTVDTAAGNRWAVHEPGERNNALTDKTAVRVSVAEAACLQSFRNGYPWQGTKTQQYQQIGNAVPPLLAAAVVREVLPR